MTAVVPKCKINALDKCINQNPNYRLVTVHEKVCESEQNGLPFWSCGSKMESPTRNDELMNKTSKVYNYRS